MVKRKIKCNECLGAISQSPLCKLSDDPFPETRTSLANLQLLLKKTRGYLTIPRDGTYRICSHAEKCIKFIISTSNVPITSMENVTLKITHQVMKNMSHQYHTLFPQLQDHMLECEPGSNHVLRLMREICQAYVKIKMYYFAERAVDDTRGMGIRVRLSRTVIFKNQ